MPHIIEMPDGSLWSLRPQSDCACCKAAPATKPEPGWSLTLRQEWLCPDCGEFVHGYCRREIGRSLEIYDMFRQQLDVLEAAVKKSIPLLDEAQEEPTAQQVYALLEDALDAVERLMGQ